MRTKAIPASCDRLSSCPFWRPEGVFVSFVEAFHHQPSASGSRRPWAASHASLKMLLR